MKARNLRDIEINSPHRAGGPVGDLMRKGTAYDVWALDPAASSGGGGSANASASGDQDGFGGMISSSSSSLPSAAEVAGVGAEELNGLSVLLPCKRKGGKLYLGAFGAFHAFCLAAGLKKAILFSSKAHQAAPCSLCAPREARKTRGCL
jgi:hypothetical protein